MKCPYCGSDLVPGYIHGTSRPINYSLKWLRGGLKPTLFNLELNGIKLGHYGVNTEWKVKSYRCIKCNKIIIDLNDQFWVIDL